MPKCSAFLVLVIIFGNTFQIDGEIFLKTKRVFCQEWAHSKNLSKFFHRFHGLEDSNEYVQPIFLYLKINVILCFSH